MKIIHVSDVHFDIPFKRLSDRENLGKERRLEQREAFRSLIDFSKENNVDVILIAGDLFEQEYIRESTIEYLNNLFKEIPEKKIFITPGNHDPKLKNSYYTIYDWNENVHIFSEKLEVVHLNEADIYGYGFNNFEMNNFNEQNIKIQNPEKNNIFISHGDIYKTSENYNPMDINELKNKFDYIALGHIHKRDEYYSGSLISLGFDEPGEHRKLHRAQAQGKESDAGTAGGAAGRVQQDHLQMGKRQMYAELQRNRGALSGAVHNASRADGRRGCGRGQRAGL